MKFSPRDYQLDDTAELINMPQKGLFHDPGCGKTYIAAMFTQYITQYTNEGVVWTQPGGIMEKNKRDILFATNLDPSQVVIVQGQKDKRLKLMKTPGAKVLLMTGQGFANEYEHLPKHFRHTVADECHLYYTLDGSTRTLNWYRAVKNMGAIVPMTGTIIRGRLDTAYPVLHVLAPQYYGDSRSFVQHHAWLDENAKVIGWKNHDRLKTILHSVGIFRSFKSIYGEEQKVIQVMNFQLSDAHRKMYSKYEETGLIEMEDAFIDSGQVGINAGRARSVLAVPSEFGVPGETEKEAYIRMMIEDHMKSGERLAIFSSLMLEQDRIVEMLKACKATYGQINGTVSNEKRQSIDAQFQTGDIQFVVASSATAGIGFNWGFLETMLFVSLDYTDDSFIQAYRRGIRGVRETPLRIVILHYADTIEDRVIQTVDRKSYDHHLINPGVDPTQLWQLSLTSR